MPDWENDPHEGTSWANDPHRGTAWSNNPHEGTVWDNRYDPRPPANESRSQRVERERLQRSADPNNRSKAGLKVPTIILFVIVFNFVGAYAYSALAGSVTANTGRNQNLSHGLLTWLAYSFYFFLPLASVILFINLLLRRYWTGTMLIIAIGLVSFVGTGIYLVISGVFFGK